MLIDCISRKDADGQGGCHSPGALNARATRGSETNTGSIDITTTTLWLSCRWALFFLSSHSTSLNTTWRLLTLWPPSPDLSLSSASPLESSVPPLVVLRGT